MNKDDEIRIGLKNAGIPETVFSTTLQKEGATTLREYVKEGSLLRPRSTSGIFLYPSKKDAATHARKLFYLFAKELFLSGVTVCCLPLSRLLDAINSDELVGEAIRVEQVRMVFVLDFYEDGAPFPFSPTDAAKLRSWVRARFEAGNAVSFLSDATIDRCSLWWPSSFLGFISDNVVVHPVAK